MYLLIDPPVTGYSPPGQIVAWIAELEQLAQLPENKEHGAREQIGSALALARKWLRTSKRLEKLETARTQTVVPHPPA